MLQVLSAQRILAWRHPVDMRKSFDGLIAITSHVLKENPLSGTIFVFHNKKRNYIKLLIWDRTGYVLYAKRLERGKFKLFLTDDKQVLNQQQLSFLLDGIPVGKRC